MKLPFVSRTRLEAAEQTIRHLEEKIELLKDANAKMDELLKAEKEARAMAEQRAEQQVEGSTRPPRMFGSMLRERATSWATERHHSQGKTK